MMKYLITILFLISAGSAFTQDAGADLNGRVYRGTATEITPPDVDRKPLIYPETITFQNGKLDCETFKNYRASESNYSSFVDGRRAVAVKVVSFSTTAEGSLNDQPVRIEFRGNVLGETKLNGTFTIYFPDNTETRFIIEAVSD